VFRHVCRTGMATADSCIAEAHFTEVLSGEPVVQAVEFVSNAPPTLAR
jgi:hypothetical protein